MKRRKKPYFEKKEGETAQPSVSLSRTMMLKIMTSRPMVTIMSSTKPNQPRTMEAVPTPDLMLPLPRSCETVAAATEAVCCQSTDTSTKMDEMKIRASATCETGRDGKGLTSTSEPVVASSSWCQPGKVASRMKVMKARMMATILESLRQYSCAFLSEKRGSYSR